MKKCDLPSKDGKFIKEAAEHLYEKYKKKNKKTVFNTSLDQVQFLEQLQKVLDLKFKPAWHVVGGDSFGYAARFALKSVCELQIKSSLKLICYKSPGHEMPLERAVVSELQNFEGEKNNRSFNVTEAKDLLSSVSDTQQDTNVASEIVARVVQYDWDDDVKKLAQRIRLRLSAEAGATWHVFVGEQFHVSSAKDPPPTTFLMGKSNKTKIVVFKHQQKTYKTTVKWSSVISLASLACLTFFYMFKRRLCDGSSYRESLQKHLCGQSLVSDCIFLFLFGILISMVVYRIMKRIQLKKQKIN
eukprot:GHVL01042494.1.p1 GENE.GHVL01042494.1~~GHVL01042494.1.p1  ORF type:complete len:300 (-),score=49.73 GHVL01042494.1:330-1229(-)